jgi:PBSX family phage terminase large subunit
MADKKVKNIEILPIYYDYVLDTDYPVYILVGGRNSGKTHFMGQYSTMMLNNADDYKFLVVEDVETNINEGVKTNIIDRIEEFGYSSIFHDTKQPPRIVHKATGNSVLFKGYHSKKQQKRVKSLNGITSAWYEEAQNITYEQFKALQMQLRGGNPQDRKLFLTMNPINQDGFINNYFFKQKPDQVFEYFDDGRPKVFTKDIVVEVGDQEVVTTCMVIVTTYKDNRYLTLQQIAAIEELKHSDPDLYKMLAEGKFVKPEGTLLKELSKFSLSKLELSQAAKLTAIVDTASSGEDSATLGIYAKYDEEHHYLVSAYKDDRDANIVIPIMASMINKFEPQNVRVEENHEGLYYESELKKKTRKKIKVSKFRSTENKHEKILSQSGRMRVDFFVRDDGDEDYNDFITEVMDYNKDPKENKHDDCIDNIAMYFKHGDKESWGW